MRRYGFPTALYFAAAGLFFGFGAWSECRGDGSAPLSDPALRPSGYCTASHLWRFPGSAAGLLLPLAIYLTPAAVVVVCAYASRRTGSKAVYIAGLIAAGLMVSGLALLALRFSYVRYHGV
ncbi:MAG TPA: hypothetical protein VG518_02585 [Solirubrobacterales bacterium]|nr:hypothetical protein [Solirubrobacterales bacterium]